MEEQTLRRKIFEITQKYNDSWDVTREVMFLIKDQRNLIESMWRDEND